MRSGADTGKQKLPQDYTEGFQKTLQKGMLKIGPTVVKWKAANLFSRQHPTSLEIQDDLPATISTRSDRNRPGMSRTDAFFADRMLNGFNTTLLIGRDRQDPSKLRMKIQWGEVPSDGSHDLADVDVTFGADADGEVLPVAITLVNRVAGEAPGPWARVDRRTFTPPAGATSGVASAAADWEAAKRVVRVQYLLQGALDGHIVDAHFRTESYSVAAHRCLHRSPVRHLLLPHFEEVSNANNDGDNFAWGAKGLIPVQSALKIPVEHNRMAERFSACSWAGWEPRRPLTPQHRYARAAWLFWDMLTSYVDGFFAEHDQEIRRHWQEIRRFSDDLLAHSLPWSPDPARADPDIDYGPEERYPEALPRAVIDGIERALHPITAADAPDADDLARLRQLCRYCIFHATFNHTWVHNGQYQEQGELRWATLSLRNGSMGPEDDESLLPSPEDNIASMSTNTLGIYSNYGYIIADEEQDVPPALRQALEARRAEFAALNVDIDYIRSRINI